MIEAMAILMSYFLNSLTCVLARRSHDSDVLGVSMGHYITSMH